jgi:hypothetical protein
VPNLAFLVGAYFLVRWVRLVGDTPAVAAMIAGCSLVLLGGSLQALWKLLYTVGVGDFSVVGELQFVFLAPGFLAMLVSLVLILRKGTDGWMAPLTAMAVWKIPLLAVMTVSSLGVYGILTYIAFRRRARLAAALFVLTVVCTLGIAGMATGEQTVARQWIEEGINSLAQIAFALGCYRLYAGHIKRRWASP